MAYIGQVPTTGDNNFRVLDDIKSYTLIFDGSSSSVVSTTNYTITQFNHRFITAQRVTYNNGGGSSIGGLTSGNAYYIIKVDQNTIQFATSATNANNNNPITLTALGSGTSHTINAAFDGINTKFKATYDTGNKAQFSRSAQLQISVNGVLQQPQDTNKPINGFGLDSDSTIVFSLPPAATDTFWGSVIANSYPTFDVSDNTVDTFTGTGSQTNFTLSKTPANNQNVLVTINGVVQYPSDATTSRSYYVDANVLTFSAAPSNGSVIQVRHIGFAGATSSAVTGFYGRTGNVGLTTADVVNIGAATIGVGAAGTTLLVRGNARITGILTIGTGSITLDGTTNTISGIDQTSVNNSTFLGIATFANGPVIIGTSSSTGTASQVLQATGGAYVSGNLGVGIINPSQTLDVQSTSGGTTLRLRNSSGNFIDFYETSGLTRQGYIGYVSINDLYINNNRATGAIRFGVNDTEKVRIDSSGNFLVGTATSTGTASQPLQVTGSAYIAGDSNFVGLGIGITNATAYPLDIRLSSGNTAAMLRLFPTTTTRSATISYQNSGSSNMITGLLNNAGACQGISGLTAYAGVVGMNAGTSPLLITTNALERVRVFDTGEVGIGTTTKTGTVSQPLQVTGGAYVSGNLGVGITNPTTKLQVRSAIRVDGNVNPYLSLNDGTNTGYLQIATGVLDLYHNSSITFSPGGTERARFDSSGNLGIGLTNPVYKLNVQDTIAITNNASNISNLIFPVNGSASYNTWITADGRTSGYLAINTNNAERLRINSSGNIGIGTNSPSSTVDVLGLQANTGATSANAPTGTLRLAYDGGAVGGNYGSSLVFSQRWNSPSNGQVAVGQITGVKIAGDGNFGGGLAFFTSNGTGNDLAERARFDSSGNFSIGSGNLVIGTSGKGIDFSANANAAGMTSELLDDYEQGTFTPTLSFGGGSTGIVYSFQPGNYVKIGTMVFVRVGVLITNKGSSTGVARINGLPFTIKSLSYGDATGACGYGGMTGLTGSLCLVGENNNNIIYILQSSATSRSSIDDSVFTNNAYIFGTFCYNVA